MKHYVHPLLGLQPTEIVIRAPFDATIVRFHPEDPGTQVFLRPTANPIFTVRLFHISVDAGVIVGKTFAAGERIGTAATGSTDIAVLVFVADGTRMISVFDVMTDALFAQYQARGIQNRAGQRPLELQR